MTIIIRDYSPGDFRQAAQVVRDGFSTLKASRGGQHPDDVLDRWLGQDDKAIVGYILKDTVVIVAENAETGEIAGLGAYTNRVSDRLLGSTYLKGLYVREKYQRGKSGPHVGTLLREERIRQARAHGFRKIYAFSVPESIKFHEKGGAKFYPSHDMAYMRKKVRVSYFEIELRKSILNRLRVEPYLHKSMLGLSYFKNVIAGLFRVPKPEF